jgi:uncharacterized protein YdbL (DUF1318 family)
MKHFFLAALLGNAFFLANAHADLESMKARVPKIVELKDQGAIGEQPDGLLGVVKATGDAKAVVDAENADRMEEYKKRAATQKQKVETLQQVLGAARIQQEKAGRMIRDAAGGWKAK